MKETDTPLTKGVSVSFYIKRRLEATMSVKNRLKSSESDFLL